MGGGVREGGGSGTGREIGEERVTGVGDGDGRAETRERRGQGQGQDEGLWKREERRGRGRDLGRRVREGKWTEGTAESRQTEAKNTNSKTIRAEKERKQNSENHI